MIEQKPTQFIERPQLETTVVPETEPGYYLQSPQLIPFLKHDGESCPILRKLAEPSERAVNGLQAGFHWALQNVE
jgi:hypothetical protein